VQPSFQGRPKERASLAAAISQGYSTMILALPYYDPAGKHNQAFQRKLTEDRFRHLKR
jgi:hypothetical protein